MSAAENRSQNETLREVRDLIQWTVTIAIFFSSFVSMSANEGGANEIKPQLVFGFGIGSHIANYFLFSLIHKDLTKNWLGAFKILLGIGAFSFAPVIIFLSTFYYNPEIDMKYAYLFIYAPLALATLTPPVIFFLILTFMLWTLVVSPFSKTKRLK